MSGDGEQGGFVSCVCHKGAMWDPREMSDDGHCPQWQHEQKTAATEDESE